MAVREGILLLLGDGPKYGYQLRNEFDEHVGAAAKPLNIGQVYATLDRLARAGLVAESAPAEPPPDGDDPRRRRFELTDAGRSEVDGWVSTAVPVEAGAGRSELLTKVVLAVQSPQVDELAVIERERAALVGRLQGVRRELRGAETLTRRLTIDAAAARIEADLGWLDRCEARVREGMRERTRKRGQA
jgi:DNA-binding PadR family transcriptional regulator